ncbi:hypothetical protein EON62_05405, partial [archaeon]
MEGSADTASEHEASVAASKLPDELPASTPALHMSDVGVRTSWWAERDAGAVEGHDAACLDAVPRTRHLSSPFTASQMHRADSISSEVDEAAYSIASDRQGSPRSHRGSSVNMTAAAEDGSVDDQQQASSH